MTVRLLLIAVAGFALASCSAIPDDDDREFQLSAARMFESSSPTPMQFRRYEYK